MLCVSVSKLSGDVLNHLRYFCEAVVWLGITASLIFFFFFKLGKLCPEEEAKTK